MFIQGRVKLGARGQQCEAMKAGGGVPARTSNQKKSVAYVVAGHISLGMDEGPRPEQALY